MNYLSLSLGALIPALLLCWYIYEKDRMEKEPIGLLAALFLGGAVVFFPVYFCEKFFVGQVDKLFMENMEFSLTSVITFTDWKSEIAHHFLCGFIIIAILEEGIKWLLVYFPTRKNKNFDHLFDGIIFAVFVALGFAAAENVFYAIRDGWSTFLIRSFISVPSHMMFAVFMGWAYTIWNALNEAKELEKEYEQKGLIVVEKPFSAGKWLAASWLLPMMIHGCYSFLRLYTSKEMLFVFYGFVLVLYGICFTGVRKMSIYDCNEKKVAFGLLTKKYPMIEISDEEVQSKGEYDGK